MIECGGSATKYVGGARDAPRDGSGRPPRSRAVGEPQRKRSRGRRPAGAFRGYGLPFAAHRATLANGQRARTDARKGRTSHSGLRQCAAWLPIFRRILLEFASSETKTCEVTSSDSLVCLGPVAANSRAFGVHAGRLGRPSPAPQRCSFRSSSKFVRI